MNTAETMKVKYSGPYPLFRYTYPTYLFLYFCCCLFQSLLHYMYVGWLVGPPFGYTFKQHLVIANMYLMLCIIRLGILRITFFSFFFKNFNSRKRHQAKASKDKKHKTIQHCKRGAIFFYVNISLFLSHKIRFIFFWGLNF